MQQTLTRVTTKNAAEKVARKRLSAIELAQTLGNVAEACRRSGVDRTSFYEWKRRFQTHGLEGLKDLPPIPKSHPGTPAEHVEAMIELAISNPMWGCVRLSDELRLRDISISSPTIQKMLIKRNLGSRFERILEFEHRVHTRTARGPLGQRCRSGRCRVCWNAFGEILNEDSIEHRTITGRRENDRSSSEHHHCQFAVTSSRSWMFFAAKSCS
jgi:hypothetical protein